MDRGAARGRAGYREAGLGELVELPSESPGARSCFHLFAIASERREEIRAALAAGGIESRVYYTPILPDQPALEEFGTAGPLPGARRYEAQVLALPMGESLERPAIETVVETIRGCLR